ncbi:hypothetical protein Dimus_011975 [Dionaea muscipula]
MFLKSLCTHSTVLVKNPNLSTFNDSIHPRRTHGDCLAFSCSRRWNTRVCVTDGGDKRRLSFYSDKDDKHEQDTGEGKGIQEREVRCEVDVISWRERRIKAEISVNADLESVWNVLTDYERLADFIPNLVCS